MSQVEHAAGQCHPSNPQTAQHLPLVIVQMGRPPQDIRDALGEQGDWMTTAIGPVSMPVIVIRPEDNEPLPAAHELAGAVITGSWSMVTDRLAWSETTAEWIRAMVAAQVPMLGVCYGHQLMADALGGTVDFHPKGREIGPQTVHLQGEWQADPLLGQLPNPLVAYLTHEQSVLKAPNGAKVLGRSDHDSHQIIRYSPTALSVQFHPEFTPALMAACLLRRAEVFKQEGFDIDGMVASIQPTPDATHLLQAFVNEACLQ